MDFQTEKFTDIEHEVLPLLEKHWAEVSVYDDLKVDVNTESYKVLSDNEALIIFTARVDGKLVGYASFFLGTSLHIKTLFQAIQDAVYLDKQYRSKDSGFIKWCETRLKDMGVQIIFHMVKENYDWSKSLMGSGYKLDEKVYSRRLDL